MTRRIRSYGRLTPLIFAVLIFAFILAPAHVTYAQVEGDVPQCEGSGILYWPCRILDTMLSTVQNIINFIINGFTGFITLILDVIRWMFDTVGNIMTFIANLIQLIASIISEIFRLINEAIQIAVLVVQIIVALIGRVGSWMFQMVGLVTGFLTSFFAAAPTAIPGMPQCISAPVAHDLCAIWYLGDNTIWSGSVGGLIVSIILIIIDVSIVFVFARKVMTLIGMGETVTDV